MNLLASSMNVLSDIFMMGDSTMCDYKPGSYRRRKDEVRI